jgi:hypothetical protein
MRIGKPHAFPSESIKGRGLNLATLTTKAFDIAIAQVIAEDKHNVGICGGRQGRQNEGIQAQPEPSKTAEISHAHS